MNTINQIKKFKLNLLASEKYIENSGNPIIISGPCSAESEKQIITTAKELVSIGKVHIFRAGIWKPRTRPNSFEGVGQMGLAWLNQVKEETGLLTMTEVANSDHVELCLENGIDILWIGARTTANPFSVQDIADALKGVDIPIMVKNPINPALDLWIGALERINNAGINKLFAIHRGFTPFTKSSLRNIPKWEYPIELKRLCPDLNIICDPSHISGNKEYIQKIAQKAMDLNMAGLMIECHIQPKSALSDAKQQVTPKELKRIINNLTIRKASITNEDFMQSLLKFRSEIDEIDDQILQLLAQRMSISERIGEYKREHGVTILQVKRWDNITTKLLRSGEALGINSVFLKKILDLIHKESINHQVVIMNNGCNLKYPHPN
jgi:chorismate mutase